MSRYSNATKAQLTRSFQPVAPYDSCRLRGPERRTLQNFLLRQLNFPSEIRRGEHFIELWNHKVDPETWMLALGLIKETARTSSFIIDGSTDASFLALCQKMIGKAFKATGGIAVLFTDSATHRPIVRLSVVGITAPERILFNGNEGPHIRVPGAPVPAFDLLTEAASSWGFVARGLDRQAQARRRSEPETLLDQELCTSAV